MAIATEILDQDLSGWVVGTRFFGVDDGTFFVVSADVADYPELGKITVVRSPTVVLFATATAAAADLVPDFTFPPGTSCEDAVTQAGYTLNTEGTN